MRAGIVNTRALIGGADSPDAACGLPHDPLSAPAGRLSQCCPRRALESSIAGLFDVQVRQTPDAIALTCADRSVSYRALQNQAESLADHLTRIGVQRGDLVALHIHRSIESIAGLLAILKAGAAYVGLPPATPKHRLANILAEVRPRVVLTTTPLLDELPAFDAQPLLIDRLESNSFPGDARRGSNISASDLAYVSFTSGSEGRPKGVCIPHRGVVRLATDCRYLRVTSDETFLHLSPVSFDASTFEIWCCLLNGARLVLYPPHMPALDELQRVICRHRVTTLWLTAGLFHLMVDGRLAALRPLRRLIAGGDVLSPRHVKKVITELPHLELINGYGPTECTTFTCCYRVSSALCESESVPIGGPLHRTELHIVDEQLRPASGGEPGELLVGGDALADGYLNQPDLTARKFVPNPFSRDPAARLYRTGDRVRLRGDGNLEFLGRLDEQIKIRGHRVEPAEIEAALHRHPGVGQAAVMPINADGIARLLSFVAPPAAAGNEHLTAQSLRQFLSALFPSYMIPSEMIILDKLPLAPSGKVDRDALRMLYSAPRTIELAAPQQRLSAQELLQELCQKSMGLPRVEPDANLWELGLDSLQAIALLLHIGRHFGRSLTPDAILRAPTVRQLAALLGGAAGSEPSLVPLQPLGQRPPLFCIHLSGGRLNLYRDLAACLGPDRPVYGVPAPAASEADEPVNSSFEQLAAYHVRSIKALGRGGPYHLCGFCFGGLLALEIAQQLRAAGDQVGLLAVMDFPMNLSDRFRFPSNPRSVLMLARNSTLWGIEVLCGGSATRQVLLRQALRGMPRLLGRTVPDPPAESELQALHERAWPRYRPRPYAGAVVLFRPRRLPLTLPYDPALGWSRIAANLQVRIAPGPGIHTQMFRQPHVQQLAQQLRTCLDDVEASLTDDALSRTLS